LPKILTWIPSTTNNEWIPSTTNNEQCRPYRRTLGRQGIFNCLFCSSFINSVALFHSDFIVFVTKKKY
jgi:hypothetical protein